MDKLLTYAYPGNVRELENILERAVTLCSGIGSRPRTSSSSRARGPVELPEIGEDAAADGLEGQLEHIEREAIVKALEQTRYNKTKAAAAAGDDVSAVAVSGEEARDRVRPRQRRAD
jgi:two-component system, NtrC family, response regulator PilR